VSSSSRAPAAVYEEPANTFVASFFGTPPMNLLRARSDGDALLIGGRRCVVPQERRDRLARLPEKLVVGIRPEAFAAAASGAALVASTDAGSREVLGSETLLRATLGAEPLSIRLPGIVRTPPETVAADFAALHFFSAEADGVRLT